MWVLAGVALLVVGLLYCVGGYVYSASDYAWSHRNSRWARHSRVPGSRQFQTGVWKTASVVVGMALIVAGVACIALKP
jgi:uncharacterized membrane protein HdeD (DUF308 family)